MASARIFPERFWSLRGCGASMQAVSRRSGARRIFRFVCGHYWNRGASVCPNGQMVTMETVDAAVRHLLAETVLKPERIERAIDQRVVLQGKEPAARSRRELQKRIVAVEEELGNLAGVAAAGGAVPAVMTALKERESERLQLQGELARAEQGPAALCPAKAGEERAEGVAGRLAAQT